MADANKNEEDITMEVIVDVAESVDGMIKFSYDVPSTRKSLKLAVLDVKVNMNKWEANRIDCEFFEKPTRNKNVRRCSSSK